MHGYQHLFFPWIVYQLHIWGNITPWQPMLDAKPSVFSGGTHVKVGFGVQRA